MRPTEILSEEHEAIRLMLAILWAISEKMEAGEELDIEHLDQALDFMKNFADEYHHRKEEDLLFTELEKSGMQRDGGPTGAMIEDHNIGRKHMSNIYEALSKFKSGDQEAKKDIISNIRDYATLLDEHINKENDVLYPLANERMTPEVEEAMLDGFEKASIEAGGEAKGDEYNALLDKLAEAYLSEYEDDEDGDKCDDDHECCSDHGDDHERGEDHVCTCNH